MRLNTAAAVFVATVCLIGCDTPTEPNGALLASGWWSANGTSLHVTETNAALLLGCYAGTFSRPFVDRHGRFDVDGHLTGGPGPPPPTSSPGSAAHFTGEVSGSALTLTMTTQYPFGGATARTYRFQFSGAEPPGPLPPPCP